MSNILKFSEVANYRISKSYHGHFIDIIVSWTEIIFCIYEGQNNFFEDRSDTYIYDLFSNLAWIFHSIILW